MASLKFDELVKLAEQMRLYGLGSQLQEIALTERHLFLQHYGKGNFTIGLELTPLSPRLGYFFGDIPKKKNFIKPIVLFLKAHARNHRLIEIIVEESLGRIVRLKYSGEPGCVVEFRLIPHAMNILVHCGGKSISLFPAKTLPLSTVQRDLASEFDLEAYLDSWVEALTGPTTNKSQGSNPQLDQGKKRQKEIDKKNILIEKLTLDFESMNKPWLALGEYLKAQMSLDVPEEWQVLLDQSLPLMANMQRCFEKHKLQEKRREQVQERIEHLKKEVADLQSHLSNPTQNGQERPVRSMAGELLSKAKAKGRKLVIAENVEAVFGKSAKDNMALLRRAQAWDLWLHLRDLPGAHLIIRRPRQKNVDHQQLLEAARWLLNETIGKKKVIDGDRYDVIITECRHVKPIKGDKLGRVNYQNETTLTLRV